MPLQVKETFDTLMATEKPICKAAEDRKSKDPLTYDEMKAMLIGEPLCLYMPQILDKVV